jgi:hypothetical protein
MARAPNYGYERSERDKAKAAKKAEKAEAKKTKAKNPAEDQRAAAPADGPPSDTK